MKKRIKKGEISSKLACRENSRQFAQDATTGFPTKRRLRDDCRNSILMTSQYPYLGSASDLKQISHAARPIRSTTQIWVVTRHKYGISALVPQTSFGGKTSRDVAKCRLFFRPTQNNIREYKMLRWRRQRERQKSNRLNKQNNNSARASRILVHFFAVSARLRRENA